MGIIQEWWILTSGAAKGELPLQFTEPWEDRCGYCSLQYIESWG